VGSAGLIWRGEIYDIDLGVPIGHEPAHIRPGLIVSADLINNGPGGLVGVVPITSTRYGLRSHTELEPGDTGFDHDSFARCDQIRMLSTKRLSNRRGRISPESMPAIDLALRFVLDL
jgi:mRNA interferase MazF